MKNFDIVIIGGGPGGYVAALRASNLGKSVALIEKLDIGGTCLNKGCIPSKTFLSYAKTIENIQQAKTWGIETGELSISLDKLKTRNKQVIKGLRSGIAGLIKKEKITYISGDANVTKDKKIEIKLSDDTVETISGDKIIVATGSTPFVPDLPGIDDVNYYTSDTIFDIKSLPESLAIIGGGVIGVEFANIFSSLGVKVTIIEMADRLVPGEDKEATKLLQKHLKSMNVKFSLGSEVKEMKNESNKTALYIQNAKNEEQVIECDDVLIAIGRKANLSAIHELDLKMTRSFVAVNSSMETSLDSVYAIGDLVGGYQLAHVASAEGLVAAHHASGGNKEMDYSIIPRCVYTTLEISSVGINEKQAKEKGIAYRVVKYNLAGNGKAITMGEAVGFIKLIIEEKYGEILGVVMTGPNVTEMISQASSYMFLEGTVEELEGMIQPHPSLSESLFEAAASYMGRGIHS